MNNRPPSAAASIYPHLPHDKAPVQAQRQQPRLADALYPSLAPKPKPPPNADREALLRNLRALNKRIDARLQKEGRR
jgi:hypothetical protein